MLYNITGSQVFNFVIFKKIIVRAQNVIRRR